MNHCCSLNRTAGLISLNNVALVCLGACFSDLGDLILEYRGHKLDKGILLMIDDTFSTLNIKIHLASNQGDDAMFNFLLEIGESRYYDVIVVGCSKFCLEYSF